MLIGTDYMPGFNDKIMIIEIGHVGLYLMKQLFVRDDDEYFDHAAPSFRNRMPASEYSMTAESRLLLPYTPDILNPWLLHRNCDAHMMGA